MELQFVNATNLSSGNEVKANKTRVRTLAMRGFVKKKTKEKSKIRVKASKPMGFYDYDITSGTAIISSDNAWTDLTDNSVVCAPTLTRRSSNVAVGISSMRQRLSHEAYLSPNLNPRSQTKNRLDPFSSFHVDPLRDDLLLCDFCKPTFLSTSRFSILRVL